MPTTFLKNPVSMDAGPTNVSLTVSGTPAPATTGAAAPTAATLVVVGTPGQETTGTGQTAGAGADVSISAGAGGGAPAGATNGAGGSVTINPGSPGSGSGTAAIPGNVLLATTGGKVGVGTASPTTRLDVRGNAQVDSTQHNDWTLQVIERDNAFPFAVGRFEYVGSAVSTAYSVLSAVGGGAEVFSIRGDGKGYFAGRLGIGTTAPSAALHVAQDVLPAVVRIEQASASSSAPTLVFSKSRGTLSSPSNVQVDDFTGTFGCSGYLNGAYVNAGRFDFKVTAVAANLIDTSLMFSVASISQGDENGTLEAMRIDSSGRVGIGLTAPGSKLHVYGGIQVGVPTGGDKGTGSINVAGDIYKNGTPLLAKLEEAYSQIAELTKRIDRLEAGRALKSAKPAKSTRPAKSKQSNKPRKASKERR